MNEKINFKMKMRYFGIFIIAIFFISILSRFATHKGKDEMSIVSDDLSYRNMDGKSLCLKATTEDGEDWADSESIYVKEAKDRDFTLYLCNRSSKRK